MKDRRGQQVRKSESNEHTKKEWTKIISVTLCYANFAISFNFPFYIDMLSCVWSARALIRSRADWSSAPKTPYNQPMNLKEMKRNEMKRKEKKNKTHNEKVPNATLLNVLLGISIFHDFIHSLIYRKCITTQCERWRRRRKGILLASDDEKRGKSLTTEMKQQLKQHRAPHEGFWIDSKWASERKERAQHERPIAAGASEKQEKTKEKQNRIE